jgi:hypothetical protein
MVEKWLSEGFPANPFFRFYCSWGVLSLFKRKGKTGLNAGQDENVQVCRNKVGC